MTAEERAVLAALEEELRVAKGIVHEANEAERKVKKKIKEFEDAHLDN